MSVCDTEGPGWLSAGPRLSDRASPRCDLSLSRAPGVIVVARAWHCHDQVWPRVRLSKLDRAKLETLQDRFWNCTIQEKNALGRRRDRSERRYGPLGATSPKRDTALYALHRKGVRRIRRTSSKSSRTILDTIGLGGHRPSTGTAGVLQPIPRRRRRLRLRLRQGGGGGGVGCGGHLRRRRRALQSYMDTARTVIGLLGTTNHARSIVPEGPSNSRSPTPSPPPERDPQGGVGQSQCHKNLLLLACFHRCDESFQRRRHDTISRHRRWETRDGQHSPV